MKTKAENSLGVQYTKRIIIKSRYTKSCRGPIVSAACAITCKYILFSSIPKVYDNIILCARERLCAYIMCNLCIPLSRYRRRSCDCNKSNLVGFEDHTRLSGRRSRKRPREEAFSRFSFPRHLRVYLLILSVRHMRIEPAATTPRRC